MRSPPYCARGVALGIADIVAATNCDHSCGDALMTAARSPICLPAGATKARSAVFGTIYPDLDSFIWLDCRLMQCGMGAPHPTDCNPDTNATFGERSPATRRHQL